MLRKPNWAEEIYTHQNLQVVDLQQKDNKILLCLQIFSHIFSSTIL
ncbi:hypothetical protein B595_0651 [Chlamydia psittaci 84/55]|nr:hypothetical protein B595_0651 [Chlamydia psittaci 84/55]